eukprot:TRINITY_DN3709_c0_g1_i5.p1 TRINITY_DN3709_c0_g1~~TRINITY_DN3709_c0_g1_i5.p1  ORF type:complete len:302 (+),score=68.41 TRINITY_DN3709_c0_g1_i5:303-1208(+)
MAEQFSILEKKYKALKKKAKILQDENTSLAGNYEKVKLKANRLQKERTFLLDRLLRYEDASDDDVSSSNSDEEDDPQNLANINLRTAVSIASPSAKIKDEGFNFAAKARAEDLKRKKGLPMIPQNHIVSNNSMIPAAKKSKKSKSLSGQAGLSSDNGGSACLALGKDKKNCKSKPLAGLQYCWHHAPLDPNSGFIFCQYVDPTKKAQKKCNIPVPKSKSIPYCNYHEKLIIPRRERQQPLVPENTESVEGEGDNYQNDDYEDDSGMGGNYEEALESEDANIVDEDEDDDEDDESVFDALVS